MSLRRILASLVLAACSLVVAPVSAAEEGYPGKPITFVVPYAAGGAADVFIRALAPQLAQRLKVPVVVENRPGANGNIGSAAVAKGAADGYTLLLGTSSTIAINPHLYTRSMPYDPLRDLQPVSLMHVMPNVLVVNTATPFHNVQDLVAAARAHPGTLMFGSPGNGNTMHLAAELFKTKTGTQMQHVPYKSGPNALTDVVAGHLPFMFNNLPAVVELVNGGKLRALAVTSRTRTPLLADVPTMIEAGVPDYESTVWSGVFVKAGTPAPIVARLNGEIAAVLATPSFRKPLEDQGYMVVSNTPEAFAKLIAADFVMWGRIVKDAHAQLD